MSKNMESPLNVPTNRLLLTTITIGLLFSLFTPKSLASNIRELHVDLEVAICPEGELSLTELERPFLDKNSDPFEFDLNQDLIDGLKEFSPSRARALKMFKDDHWLQLKPLKNSTLRPRTGSTAIISRQDCVTKILAHITLSHNGHFSGFIDADLLEIISQKTKQLLIAEAYFYFESMYWAMMVSSSSGSPHYWDPTRTRYFLTQWLNSSIRPINLPDFVKLIKYSDLNFVEQSGVLIPLLGPKPIEWNTQTGLVTTSYNPYKTSLWTTYLHFPQQNPMTSIPYTGWNSVGPNSKVTFHPDGRLHCLPLYKSSTSPYKRAQISEQDEWTNPPYGDSSKNLCVYPNGNVQSGYLSVGWNETKTWIYQNSIMTIARPPLAGGNEQGTWITFFPNGFIRSIEDSHGMVNLQNKRVKIEGPMKFELIEDSHGEGIRLKCASLPVGSRWLDNRGRELVVSSRAQTFCFNKDERIEDYCTRPFCRNIF